MDADTQLNARWIYSYICACMQHRIYMQTQRQPAGQLFAVYPYSYSYVYASYLLPCVYTYSYSHQPTEHADGCSFIRIRMAAGRQAAYA